MDVLEGPGERGRAARGSEHRYHEAGSINKAAHVAPNATMANACPNIWASIGLEPKWLGLEPVLVGNQIERTKIWSKTATTFGLGNFGPEFGPFTLNLLPKPSQNRPQRPGKAACGLQSTQPLLLQPWSSNPHIPLAETEAICALTRKPPSPSTDGIPSVVASTGLELHAHIGGHATRCAV